MRVGIYIYMYLYDITISYHMIVYLGVCVTENAVNHWNIHGM